MNEDDKIYLITKTWTRDSHGLFDYESSSLNTKKFDINNSGYLIRKDYHVSFVDNLDQNTDSDNKVLCYYDCVNHTIISPNIPIDLPINNQTLIDLQEQIWYVVKSNSNFDVYDKRLYSEYEYELKQNDIIKLGRIKFVVKKINLVGHQHQLNKTTFAMFENPEDKVKDSNTDIICHICYLSDISEDNPMLSICKCKGTMHTHLNCLKKWLNSKKTVEEITGKMGVSYTIQKFNCEICKEPFPSTVKSNDKYYNLIEYEEPQGQNYIILQSLNSIKENSYPLSVHVLMFIENEGGYILGRGHESDLRISDISVSRSHARIYMKNNKFYMEDLKSKFGTLVLAKNQVKLEDKCLFQIGKSLVYYGKDKDKNNKEISPLQQILNEFSSNFSHNMINDMDKWEYNCYFNRNQNNHNNNNRNDNNNNNDDDED